MAQTLAALRRNPFFRYLAPFFLFMLLGEVQGQFTGEVVWFIYGLKVIITLIFFAWCFSGYRQEIAGSFDFKAVGVGVLVLAVWLAWCELFPGGSAPAFDPAAFDSTALAAAAIIMRMIGACVAAPLLEEIVWRSFIMRFIIKEDFLSVPLGTYSFYSFWFTVLTFALMHPIWQWGAAVFAGIAYGFYMIKSKNLVGCIIAHAVTNFGLAIYILLTKEWGLWN